MSTPQAKVMALSIKQPWAALVVAGLKTIEIRRWPTARRGRILIHAARISDKRPEGWARVTPEIQPLTQLLGGIIGAANLIACNHYGNPQDFQAHQSLHCNEPSWFEQSGLYGLVFAEAEILPFRKYPGWFRFFPVDDLQQSLTNK